MSALDADLVALARLVCPNCSGRLTRLDAALTCPTGHSFDIARQGYVSLLGGQGSPHRSDTAEMVAARSQVFARGLYAPLVDALAQAIPPGGGTVVDAGAGVGSYLEAVLAAHDDIVVGVALDLSKACARAAARAHPRIVSVVADLWAQIPVDDASVDTVLSVFAPRNVADTVRILRPGGHWLLVTPRPGHLAEIVEAMGMLKVGDGKADRLADDLHEYFEVIQTTPVTAARSFTATELALVAQMGPAGFHRTQDELIDAGHDLAGDGAITATLDVTVTLARRLPSPPPPVK